MSTASAGSPNDPEHEPEESGVPWVALLLGVVALIVVALIGPRLIGVLLAVISPPEPPLPPDVHLLDYSRETYGDDTWIYGTEQDTCDLVAFFRQQGALCPLVPLRCAQGEQERVQSQDTKDLVALCEANVEFSIFAMHWRFEVPLRSAPGPMLEFTLSRRVFWTGLLPPESG
ncbi:MAG: hypothetical protein K8J31_05830 [Anaerolineae bacterium]|nr:hypothetical protein [Anaerolineae bacterium]